MAAAILAAAVLALVTLQDSSLAREADSSQLLIVSRAAERLLAEAELLRDIRPGAEEGKLEGLSGCTYRREVELRASVSNAELFRIHVIMRYSVGGRPRIFNLEKWVLRSHDERTVE